MKGDQLPSLNYFIWWKSYVHVFLLLDEVVYYLGSLALWDLLLHSLD
jgi:hypothetical protein